MSVFTNRFGVPGLVWFTALKASPQIRKRRSSDALTSLEPMAGARNQREISGIDIMVSAYPATPPTEQIAPTIFRI